MKLVWIRQVDLGEAKCEEAYFDLMDGYIKNIREACDQDNYTTPRWNETHWLGHEGRLNQCQPSARLVMPSMQER